MLLSCNLKFQQRATVMVMLLFVTLVVFAITSQHNVNSGVSHRHRRMVENADNDSKVKKFNREDNQTDAEMCKAGRSLLPHYANISTYDVYHTTQFDMRSDGEWEMMTPHPKYNRSTRPPKLTVILMPHSHNDAGWGKTVNEYYTDQTKHILNNMVKKLTQHRRMTFIWAEIVYFSIWWSEIEDDVKVQVRRLIRRGQLEVVHGGWVMTDEAVSHYVSVIGQLIEGHQWLSTNLGFLPKNGWSIDPFGHSGTMPYLWKSSGMTNMVIQRVHPAVKSSLVKYKALEFYWRQMWDERGSTDILCHIMPFLLYGFKYTCGPDPFACLHFDFRNIPGDFSESKAVEISKDNLVSSAKMLYQQYRNKANYYRYNAILVPLGDDFRYDKEEEWDQQFINYEKLMNYMNSRSDWNIDVRWGTLKDYFQDIKEEHIKRSGFTKTEDFPVLSGDFFPYSDRDTAYWTGYYSTRPFDKFFSRDVQSILQAADILSTFSFAYSKNWNIKWDREFSRYSSLLQEARRLLGVFLHHDAITGTARAYVVKDYERSLLKAYAHSQEVIMSSLQFLLLGGNVTSPAVFLPETVRNSYYELPQKQVISVEPSGTTVVIFNPLGQPREQVVHLMVDYHMLEVMSSSQEIIPSQISPVWNGTTKYFSVENAFFELTFLVEVQAYAITSFVLYKKNFQPPSLLTSSITQINTKLVPESAHFHQKTPEPAHDDLIIVDNKVIQLTFDPKTGSLLQVKNLLTNNITELNLRFQIYKSKGSGAYIFFPEGPPTDLPHIIPSIRLSQGPLTITVEVVYKPYITHTVTLYRFPSDLTSAIFVENIVTTEDLPEKELIMKLRSSIQNRDLSFYTDQNGFQFIRRRPNKNQPIQASYYPMTSAAIMEDRHNRLTILSAQPHGTACLEAGELEIMLDRHLLYDDGRGMGEGVTDVRATISKFVIIAESRLSSYQPHELHYTTMSLLSLGVHDKLQQPLVPLFTRGSTFFRDMNLLPHPLPSDTTTVSFRSLVTPDLDYNGTSFIVHRRGYNCDFPTADFLSSPSESFFTFDTLFKEFNVSNIQETTLTHTTVKRTLQPSDKVDLIRMEISAFRFHL